MELKTFTAVLRQYHKRFWLTTCAIFIIGVVITLSQPLKYGTESRVMISQRVGLGVDMYTMSKSNEYLSNTMAEVVRSTSFFHDVLNSDPGVDRAYFTMNSGKQLKTWRKTVDVSVLSDSGVVVISVYHTNRAQAMQLASAINNTIRLKSNSYFNSNSELSIKVLDEPVVSNWPIKPNVLVNILSSLLMGLALATFYIYVLATSKSGVILTKDLKTNISLPKLDEKDEMVRSSSIATPRPMIETEANVVVEQEEQVLTPSSSVDTAPPIKKKTMEDFMASSDIRNVF